MEGAVARVFRSLSTLATALVEISGMRLPCAVEFVKKDTWEIDKKRGKRNVKAVKQKMNITGK